MIMRKSGLLVKRVSMTHFDCMGERVSARLFCIKMMKKGAKSFKGEYFLRGVVSKEGRILCQFGHSAVLTFDSNDFRYKGNETLKLCQKLRKHYAFNLKTFHFYESKSGKRSCYYSLDEKF